MTMQEMKILLERQINLSDIIKELNPENKYFFLLHTCRSGGCFDKDINNTHYNNNK